MSFANTFVNFTNELVAFFLTFLLALLLNFFIGLLIILFVEFSKLFILFSVNPVFIFFPDLINVLVVLFNIFAPFIAVEILLGNLVSSFFCRISTLELFLFDFV